MQIFTLLYLLAFQEIYSRKIYRDEINNLPNLDYDWDHLQSDYGLVNGESTLIASTLDGTLAAINQKTGSILWEIRDQPAVKSPYDSSKPILPAFLPNPKDGTIYMIGGGLKEPIKKLPFTIPELVSASPCKSSDGILYTGKKVDTWFSINRYTGNRQGSISFNGCVEGIEGQCPNNDPTNILIGRTEYNIMMYDSKAEGRRWNISFFDYSSNLFTNEPPSEYHLAHFSDSSSGLLLTLDRISGSIQWEIKIGSPLVALYKLTEDGISSVHFTSVSKETLLNLSNKMNDQINNIVIGETKLYPTLYVGEHDHGLYAMQSLIDEQTLMISSLSGPLLLEGPQNFNLPSEININVVSGQDKKSDPLEIPMQTKYSQDKSNALIFGHYKIPEKNEHSTVKFFPASLSGRLPNNYLISQINYEQSPIKTQDSQKILFIKDLKEISYQQSHLANFFMNITDSTYDFKKICHGWEQIKTVNISFIFSDELIEFGKEIVCGTYENVLSMDNKELKAIVILLIIAIIFLFKLLKNNPASIGLNSQPWKLSQHSVGSTSSKNGGTYEITAHPIELDNGNIRVGNITFDPNIILGKGCEGTFVYKGKFDNRFVAVKRVLAACFSIADREVDLLRESDEHPNVIRYFCMEQDRQFRYIALEYCCATLQDYVVGKYLNENLDCITILRQATQGLAHLHSLDIVHRDIKPHNVLISIPGKRGDVRAMISDFGLCKKLKVGRISFSRRSGVAGTEGWIAPEMMLGNKSTTCAVDIFSLGCVYHFVLSKGSHPFGESFKRQANILSGEYILSKIEKELSQESALSLIEKMISREFTQRPPAQAVLKHPLFWTKEKMLSFLQDVSDRVDKEDYDNAIVVALERNKSEILKGNWYDNLDPLIREDLRKHRTYNGKSVRDLLRALRNKKHHYNELPFEIKHLYGKIPSEFVNYWIERFPKLLIHSWHVMHCVKNEPTFKKYFDKNYDFLKNHVKPEPCFFPEHLKSNINFTNIHRSTFHPSFLTRDDESNVSIISHWDNYNSGKLEKAFPIAFRQVENDKSFEFENNYPDDTPHDCFQEDMIYGSLVTKESPKVIKNVVQLNSDSKEYFLQEKRKSIIKPTWAEALKNPKKKNISPTFEEIESDKNVLINYGATKNNCDNKSCVSEDKFTSNAVEAKIEESEPLWIVPQDVKKKRKKKNLKHNH